MPSLRLKERLEFLRQRLRPSDEPARSWLKRHWRSFAALGVACLAIVTFDAWLVSCGFAGCPSRSGIRAFRPGEGGRIVDRNDRFLGRIALVRRVNVPLTAIPAHVRQAFLATEDRRFYQHNGLDWRGLARAVAANVRHGGVREGFSTITMQVARNSFLVNTRGRTLRRKLIELRLTKLIEDELTKDQILELYLNLIYLGNGVNGVEAASRDLFGKSVDKLSVSEGAMLAALPKGPSAYTPRDHYDRGLKRRNLVLSLMAQTGYLSPAEAAHAASLPLKIAEDEWRPDTGKEPLALDAIRALIDSIRPDALKEGDVTVYTTLDLTAQAAADRAVLKQTTAVTRETQYSGVRVKDAAQGALVALDPRNGDIRALVGGRRSKRGFNRAFNAKRQPGSAFKPFVYATAMHAGMTPATLVDDEPVEVPQGRNKVWSPSNYDDSYLGTITLTKALEVSSNAAAVRVSQNVGIPNVIQTAHRNGITSTLPNYPAVALGAVDVTPLEIVAAYAPFGNGGLRIHPRLVRRIEAADGTVLWSSEIAPPDTVMDARDAYQITSMLQDVVDHGTARVIRDMGVRGAVAGKTGTTNNADDVWFIGYTPTLVAGVWFGYDIPRPIAPHASGGHLAAPAWADFYMNGWREPPGASGWAPPAGMTLAVIDPGTGMLAGEWCPARKREYFKPGTEPREVCNVHTEPQPDEPIFDDPRSIPIPEPIRRGADGIGNILRKIFRF